MNNFRRRVSKGQSKLTSTYYDIYVTQVTHFVQYCLGSYGIDVFSVGISGTADRVNVYDDGTEERTRSYIADFSLNYPNFQPRLPGQDIPYTGDSWASEYSCTDPSILNMDWVFQSINAYMYKQGGNHGTSTLQVTTITGEQKTSVITVNTPSDADWTDKNEIYKFIDLDNPMHFVASNGNLTLVS